MNKFLVAAFLALSVTACASGQGGNTEWMRSYGKTFYEPNQGMAAVYIVRDDPGGQDATPLSLVMSQRPVGSLSGLTWMRLDLQPALYDLRAFGTQGNTELIITVNAGQSRFLLIEPKPPGNADLREISQAEGRRLVRKGQAVASSL